MGFQLQSQRADQVEILAEQQPGLRIGIFPGGLLLGETQAVEKTSFLLGCSLHKRGDPAPVQGRLLHDGNSQRCVQRPGFKRFPECGDLVLRVAQEETDEYRIPRFGALVAEEAVHPVKQGRQSAGKGITRHWTKDFIAVHDAKIRNPGRPANTHKWGFRTGFRP